jgi:hypothetical protein
MSCPSIVLEVLQHCKLHGATRKVFIALAAYVDAYGNGVFPSLITLAQDADISERHLQRCLKQLAKDGYLTIAKRKEPGKQVRNVYTLLYPWSTTAHKSTDKPAHESTDIRCPSKDLKTQDKEREKRAASAEIPRKIDPEVLAYPNGPNLAQWLGLTPGSYVYGAALSDHMATPAPVAPVPSREGYIFQYAHA